MKKTSILFVFAIFTSSLLAQIILQHKLDTIANQDFYNETWITTSYYIYEYDAIGIQTQEKYMVLNEDGGMDIWKQVDYEHNADKKLVQRTFSWIDFDFSQELEMMLKEDISYNTEGLEEQIILYSRNPITTEWELDEKTNYEYDEFNNLIMKVDSGRTGCAIPEWEPSCRDEYIYENNVLISHIHYDWWSNEYWRAHSKYEYTYNENGQLIEKIEYEKFGLPDWAKEWKTNYSYDAEGNKTQEIINFFSETKEWLEAAKYEFSYDTYNNLNEYVLYYWGDETWDQIEKNTWEVNTGYFYENLILPYFDRGTTMSDDEIWHYPMGSYKECFNYMLNGYESQKWLNESWTHISQSSFHYSQFYTGIEDDVSENTIHVFPNPASEYIVFEMENNSQPAILRLFDLNGKLVLSKELPREGKVAVSHLKNGLYFYQISTDNEIINGKMILQ